MQGLFFLFCLTNIIQCLNFVAQLIIVCFFGHANWLHSQFLTLPANIKKGE